MVCEVDVYLSGFESTKVSGLVNLAAKRYIWRNMYTLCVDYSLLDSAQKQKLSVSFEVKIAKYALDGTVSFDQ